MHIERGEMGSPFDDFKQYFSDDDEHLYDLEELIESVKSMLPKDERVFLLAEDFWVRVSPDELGSRLMSLTNGAVELHDISYESVKVLVL